jgi:hypothetical protein
MVQLSFGFVVGSVGWLGGSMLLLLYSTVL